MEQKNDTQGRTQEQKLQEAAFNQLNEYVRTQDRMAHSWIKFMVTVEAGLALA